LPNHRLGFFIAARLLWAAGYARVVIPLFNELTI